MTSRPEAGEHGIRRFIDIGAGIPAEPRLRRVARGVAPRCSVIHAPRRHRPKSAHA